MLSLYVTAQPVNIKVGSRVVLVGSSLLKVDTSHPAVVVPLVITAQPASQTVAAGSVVGFSVAASGSSPFSYQWKANGTNISGATSATYARTVASNDNGLNLSVVVTDANSQSVTSNVAVITVTTTTANAHFAFNLAQPSTTSAGLYHGDTLVTTMWSAQNYTAGSHDTTISGYDENGNELPNGSYTAKVLSSQVLYQPIGTYMNSSDSFHGNTVWRGEMLSNMCFVGGVGYVGTSYAEANYPRYRFDTNHIQQKVLISNKQTYTYTAFSCTDGHYVYWQEQASGNSANGRIMNYTYATDPTTENEVSFSNGVAFNSGAANPHPSIIDSLGDLTNNTPRQATGMAVQKNGNYLFIARPIGINVINKTTGALVRTINITDAGFMAVNQNTDNDIWMAESNGINKRPINSDGTLGAITLTITLPSATIPDLALYNATCFAVSPDGATINILNQGSQQYSLYNTSTGAFIKSIGRQNGLFGNVLVDNSSFMFNSNFEYYPNFISYAPNGTFWIADNGNNRYMHFSANGDFIGKISFLDRNYTVFSDGNNPNNIYSKSDLVVIDPTVFPAQKGWTLTKNYKARMPYQYGSTGLQETGTWSNGRVYSTLPVANSNREIVELRDTGIRHTNILVGDNGLGASGITALDKDGNIRENTMSYDQTHFYWGMKTRTGFDGNNNPVYASSFVDIADGGTSNNNVPSGGNQRSVLSDGSVVAFNTHGTNTGFHLGIMRPSSNNRFMWQAANSTFAGYNGGFPKSNFDIGNQVNDYAGGSTVVSTSDNIYTNYNGENWKSAQANYINHYHKSGLQVGQFGIGGDRAAAEDAPTWLTGNTKYLVNVPVSGGELIIENDESKCGGLMATKASNTASVHIDSFQVVKNGITPTPTGITPILQGFPINSQVLSSELGLWTFSNPSDGNNWTMQTNYLSTDRVIPDLYLHAEQVSNFGNCSLPYVQGNNWQLAGNLAFPDVANGMFSPSSHFYFRIKDAAGKELVRIEEKASGYGTPFSIMANNQLLYTVSDAYNVQTRINNLLNYLSITRTGANITFSMFGNTVTTTAYDGTADLGQPAVFNLELDATSNAAGLKVDISGFIFNNNKQ